MHVQIVTVFLFVCSYFYWQKNAEMPNPRIISLDVGSQQFNAEWAGGWEWWSLVACHAVEGPGCSSAWSLCRSLCKNKKQRWPEEEEGTCVIMCSRNYQSWMLRASGKEKLNGILKHFCLLTVIFFSFKTVIQNWININWMNQFKVNAYEF